MIERRGVNRDARMRVLGVADGYFLARVQERRGTRPAQKTASALDFIFYRAATVAELAELKSLRTHLQPAGAIWVVSLKGKAATIRDTDVMKAARAAGLVDNKVCGFSATHTALKLVIPKDQRP